MIPFGGGRVLFGGEIVDWGMEVTEWIRCLEEIAVGARKKLSPSLSLSFFCLHVLLVIPIHFSSELTTKATLFFECLIKNPQITAELEKRT